jgi:CRP-like cAMP-binding protein
MTLSKFLEKVPPFYFLTEHEKKQLDRQSNVMEFSNGDLICGRDDPDYDFMFILVSGAISILQNDSDTTPFQVRSAPGYFGEFSIFFNQPRSASVRSNGTSTCARIDGSQIRALIEANPAFSMAFSVVLRDKQRIFRGYETFTNLLFSRMNTGFVSLRELTDSYLDLESILHPRARKHEIDFGSLEYAMNRLPEEITRMTSFFLTEVLPDMYQLTQDRLQLRTQRSRKRKFLEVLPGKCLVLLRDLETDVVDIVTKLCIYSVEMRKLRRQIEDNLYADKIAHWVMSDGTREAADRIVSNLPFSQEESRQLKKLFGDNLLRHLYEILAQHTDMMLYFERGVALHYDTTTWEQWSRHVRKKIDFVLGDDVVDPDFHIIISNTHAVVNCLSGWLHEHRNEAITWGEHALPQMLDGIEDPSDRLYIAARYWLSNDPKLAAERRKHDLTHGIHYIKDDSFAGIDACIVDVNQLAVQIDPHLSRSNQSKRKIILNIDYAYGQQAINIIHSLLLMLRGRIASISVVGKSGSLVGKRGDVLIPSRMILQTNHEFYPLNNNDLTEETFREVGFKRNIHTGSMLTVLGTVMQNNQMLRFYHLFWNVIGMEMEGSFYLREVLRGMMERLVQHDIPLRFAYYTSDTPLNPDQSLVVKMTPAEGGPAVYAITRAILRHII